MRSVVRLLAALTIDSEFDGSLLAGTKNGNTATMNKKTNAAIMQELLKKALTELPERDALVIQLYYVEELNVFEIAEVLEVSTGRVSQIKKSAIGQLRQFIQKANQVD